MHVKIVQGLKTTQRSSTGTAIRSKADVVSRPRLFWNKHARIYSTSLRLSSLPNMTENQIDRQAQEFSEFRVSV